MDFDEYNHLEKTVENPDAPKEEKVVNSGVATVKSGEKDHSRSSKHTTDENVDDLDSRSKRARRGDDYRDHDRHRERGTSHNGLSSDHKSKDGERSERDRHRREHRDREREERYGKDRGRERDREWERDHERRREHERESEQDRVRERERSRRSRSRSERHRSDRDKEGGRERDRERSRDGEYREKERERKKELRDRDRDGRTQKMLRQRDDIWKYADDLKGRFRCKFCGKEYVGGVSRLKSHLACKRGIDIGICNNVPDDVLAEALYALDNKKAKTGESSTIPTKSVTSVVQSSSPQQQAVDGMLKKKDKDGVDDDMADFFILNNISFNVIQTPAFIQMMRSAVCYGPSYSVPSYATLRTKLVQRTKQRVEEYVSVVKQSWSISGCTLMSNIWSDLNNRAFVNIVAYSPKGAIFLNSFEIAGALKSGLFLRDIFFPVIEKIGPENVVQLIFDNASNYGVAIDLILEQYPHIQRIRCAAHGVQLLLKDIDTHILWISDIFANAKMIVDFIYRHDSVVALMRIHTDGKELKKPCKTRFASNFLMLQSIIQVEDKLRMMVASSDWRDNMNCKLQMGMKVTQIISSTMFWIDGKDVLSVLEPLITVLCLIDGEGATNPFLYEAMERARNTIMERCNEDPSKYRKLLQLFDVRKESNIINLVHVAAAFLNPLFMYKGKISYTQPDVTKAMIHIIKTMVALEDKKQFGKEFNDYYWKDENLFHELSLVMLDCHPRVWWSMHGSSLPLLQKIAIRILSQPCSSSSYERNWSAFEVLQTKKRNKLSLDMMDDSVYVRMNSLMKNKSKEIEKFGMYSLKFDKLADLLVHENDGDADEEDDENEDDVAWHNKELGVDSSPGAKNFDTQICSGTRSQLRHITTPAFDFETQALDNDDT